MRMRHTRAPDKSVGRTSIVVQFRVVDESEVVIQPPLIRVVANTKFVEFDGSVRHAGSVRRMWRKKVRTVLIRHNKSRTNRGLIPHNRAKWVEIFAPTIGFMPK